MNQITQIKKIAITKEQKNMIEAASYQPVRLQGENLIKELTNLILDHIDKNNKYDRR